MYIYIYREREREREFELKFNRDFFQRLHGFLGRVYIFISFFHLARLHRTVTYNFQCNNVHRFDHAISFPCLTTQTPKTS